MCIMCAGVQCVCACMWVCIIQEVGRRAWMVWCVWAWMLGCECLRIFELAFERDRERMTDKKERESGWKKFILNFQRAFLAHSFEDQVSSKTKSVLKKHTGNTQTNKPNMMSFSDGQIVK